MKLGSVTKLDKRNKTTSKKWIITSCWKIVTLLPFFQFMANLRQYGSRNPDACIFSLIVTFYLAKAGNKTKKSLTQLSHYSFA